jgi:hypothetical protein
VGSVSFGTKEILANSEILPAVLLLTDLTEPPVPASLPDRTFLKQLPLLFRPAVVFRALGAMNPIVVGTYCASAWRSVSPETALRISLAL